MLVWTRLQADVGGFISTCITVSEYPSSWTNVTLEYYVSQLFFTFNLKYLDDPADR